MPSRPGTLRRSPFSRHVPRSFFIKVRSNKPLKKLHGPIYSLDSGCRFNCDAGPRVRRRDACVCERPSFVFLCRVRQPRLGFFQLSPFFSHCTPSPPFFSALAAVAARGPAPSRSAPATSCPRPCATIPGIAAMSATARRTTAASAASFKGCATPPRVHACTRATRARGNSIAAGSLAHEPCVIATCAARCRTAPTSHF